MSTLSVTRIENVQDFDFANTQFVSSYNTANAAYSTANTKLPLSGGTITGDLVVTGNATFSGLTTYANTQTLLIGDSLFTLNADLPSNVPATENAGMEVNRGLYGNSSIIWDETNKKWDVRSNNNTYMTITEAGDVGIGISSGLTRKFMVNGDLDNAVKMAVRNNANSNNAFTQFTVESNNTNLYAYSFPTNYLTSGRYIAGSGVIETTGPAGLTFVASSTATANITFWTGATATEKMRISSAGNIGVGNTNPQSILHVASGSPTVTIEDNTSAEPTSIAKVSFKYNSGELGFVGYDGTATGSLEVWNQYALGNVLIGTNNTERVRVTRDGNIGIGTSSPEYKLDVNGDINIPSTSTYKFGGSTVVSYSGGNVRLSDLGGGVGLYSSTLANFSLYQSTAGNIGIGTTAPTEKLHIVNGNIHLPNSIANTGAIVGSGSTDNFTSAGVIVPHYSLKWAVPNDGGSSPAAFLSGYAGVRLLSAGAERMRITSGGDVMINQTSSGGTGKLGVAGRISIDVAGSDSFSGQLYLNSGYDPSNIQTCGPSSNGMSFWTYVAGVGWNERMRITGAGNVGIGNTTPLYKLHVTGTTQLGSTRIDNAGSNPLLSFWNGTGLFGGLGTVSAVTGSGTSTDIALLADVNRSLVFYTNAGNERMRITSTGNVLIGTTTATSAYPVTVYDGVNGGISFRNPINFTGLAQNSNDFYFDVGRGGSAGNLVFRMGSVLTESMRITNAGNVGIGTTSPGYKLDVAGTINAASVLINTKPAATTGKAIAMAIVFS